MCYTHTYTHRSQRCRQCIPGNVGLWMAVHFVSVKNDLKKPGPVFNKMAEAAYDLGADYFYRVNDDTEFLQTWTTPFIQVLEVRRPTLDYKTRHVFIKYRHVAHVCLFHFTTPFTGIRPSIRCRGATVQARKNGHLDA
jgi:hypothetical protein